MSDDMNNKNIGTYGIKIKKVGALIKYTYNKLISDNIIQRLVKYNTLTPLSSKGKRYDGTIVSQPNLSEEDMNGFIFDIPFNPDIEIDKENSIYVNFVNGNFTRSNSLNIDIDVLVPVTYINLSDDYRHTYISQRINDILDGMYIDSNSDFYSELSDLKYELTDHYIYRLSKTNDFLWCKLRYKISMPIINSRVR